MTASLWLRPNPVEFLRALLTLADTRGRAVKCVGLRPLACWHCGFESRRGYGCLVFFFLLLLCSVRQRSLRRAGLSSRGILPASVVCLSVIPKPQQWGCLGLRRYLDTFAKLRTTTFSFVMFVRLSVCPSICLYAWNNSAPTGRIFMKFYILSVFRKSVNVQFSLKSDWLTGTLHEHQYTFLIYLAHFFLEWEMFQTRVVEKIKTPTLCWVTFSRKFAVCEKTVEQNCRAGQATDDNMAHSLCVLDT